MNNLQQKFKKEVVPQMMKEFKIKNPLAVPCPQKVSVNVGISRASTDPNFKERVVEDIKRITGQVPVPAKAKKAISGFKIRQGQEVGIVATLRGKRMWDFLEKLIFATLPRVRDFRGISRRSFDQQGNLNLAFKEQLVFPEILADETDAIFGLQVNITTQAGSQEKGMRLLKLLGFPLQD